MALLEKGKGMAGEGKDEIPGAPRPMTGTSKCRICQRPEEALLEAPPALPWAESATEVKWDDRHATGN